MRALTLTAAVCLIPLLTGALQAGELSAANEPLVVALEKEPINTREPIYRAYVTVGKDRFTFIVPEMFRTGGDPARGRLQLNTVGGESLITFTFVGPAPDDLQPLSPEACRALLAERYPNGKIGKEFNRPAAGRSATAFDVEWKSASGLAQKTRALYVPTVAGMLELTMTTGVKNFHACEASFNGFLGSLTASVNGKLKVDHLASNQ